MGKKIEYVVSSYLVSGNEDVVNINGEARRAKYLSTIVYDDGSEKSISCEADCHAYLREGFVVKSNGRYQFYDCEGNYLVEKDMSGFGECTEIAPLNDIYIFDLANGGPFEVGKNRFLVDCRGDECACPDQLIGIPVCQLYEEAYEQENDAELESEPLRLSEEIASLERCLSKVGGEQV